MPPKKAGKDDALTSEGCKHLTDVLLCISSFEQKLDVLRQFLCVNEMFSPYSSFCRIDRSESGFITPMNLVNFFRDNGIMDVPEATCYYVVKFFDADEDGKLSYPEYL